MRTIKGLIVVALLAFSSAFFVENAMTYSIDKVEAKVCAPGQYVNHGDDGLSAGGCADNSSKNPKSYVKDNFLDEVVNLYNPIAGTLLAVSILMIIYAAFRMMTSMGEPQKVYLAKKLLLGSGIAVVVILSSFTIMRLIMLLIGAV
ncbi:hypothetical protein AAGG74_18455 [Bacillus mexicanus]|uniref:hypothetical protein n=1 Tax=Bacillus mexicanus TaxID=2834415 RepID=UPI003D20C2A4